MSKRREHQAARKQREALDAKLVALEADLRGRTGRCEAARAAAATREGRQASLDVARALQAARAELDVATREGAKARAEAATRQQAYEATMRRFVATQAPRLAEALVDGHPCPVCGSPDHPSPARHEEGAAVGHATVDAARDAWAQAQARATEWAAKAAGAAQRLGEAISQAPEALAAEVVRLEAAVKEAAQAAASLPTLERTLAEGEREKGRVEEERRSATGREAAAAEAERAAEEEARALAEQAQGIDPAALGAREAAAARLESGAGELGKALLLVAATRASEDSALATLEGALRQGGFADAPAAEAVLLPPEKEAALRSGVEAWREALVKATAILAELAKQGLPEARPATAALAEAARIAREAAHGARDLFAGTSASLAEARRQHQLALEKAAASADLRERHRSARVVLQTCNGDVGMRVRLERWVLAGELDRVSRHANRHFSRMTRGRFQLRRAEGQARFALSLEVLDADTGRGRPVSSLSGGEQFQASLSLALGLADVVGDAGSSHAGPFNALFIDEGFGSLDEKSLAEAVETLRGLQSGGRMIGAITHVQAMRAELPVGIEVLPRADGRGSRIARPG